MVRSDYRPAAQARLRCGNGAMGAATASGRTGIPPSAGRSWGVRRNSRCSNKPGSASKTADRQVVFVGGEPGAGKSRLVAEVAGTLAEHGVAVLVGNSTAEAGIPYEPFAELLDRLLTTGSAGQLTEPLQDAGPQLCRLSPNVIRHQPGVGPTDDPGALRRLLFDALTDFLRRLSSQRPLALVLEDLHWAQAPTLAMLEHVLTGCADARILVVATFRTTEPNRSEELLSRLAEMHRFDGVRAWTSPGWTPRRSPSSFLGQSHCPLRPREQPPRCCATGPEAIRSS